MRDFKKDFPIFQNNPGLVFLDNAASTQKPAYVIDGVKEYLENDYANIHRGAYELSQRSEDMYHNSKQIIASHIGAKPSEIIYTFNSTYAFNVLAGSLAKSGMLKKGDKVLLSISEHHANIVPWLIVKEQIGIQIEYVNITKDYELDIEDFKKKYDDKVKVVSMTLASNVSGTIFDLKTIGKLIREDTIFVIDGSQAVQYFKVDVNDYNADFFIFTGHKLMALTGIGVLRGKKELLKKMSPSIGGGGSILDVKQQSYELTHIPESFEPGTPNLAGADSLLKAFEYVEKIGGFDVVWEREEQLVKYALSKFNKLSDKVQLIGKTTYENRLGVFSFIIKNSNISINRIGEIMAENNVCIRCGGHCAHPLLENIGCQGTCRMSLYFYNDFADIDKFFEILEKLI